MSLVQTAQNGGFGMKNKALEKILVGIIGTALVVGAFALSFVLTSAIIYGICWAFKLVFTWRFAFGIWLILLILRSVFRGEKHD